MTLRTLVDAVVAEIVPGAPLPYYNFLCCLVRQMRPRNVLELGTGIGLSAMWMMGELPPDSTLTTINLPNPPSGDDVGAMLRQWADDKRLTQILGDTRDPAVVARCKPGVDLLFIDSGTKHEYALVSEEWRLYEPLLADLAIVCLDDIRANDMPKFWDWLPYEKIATDLSPFGFGVVQYARGK